MLLTLLQSGGAGPGGITGNLAATETGADTFAAEGLVKVQGALAAAESASDAFSAAGIVKVQGELAATETGTDTFAASGGTVSTITGNLAATESGADVMSAEGIVKVQGTLAATESGSDTFAATGDTVFFTITGTQALRLMHIHLLHGLGIGTPLEVSATARTAGALAQTVSESGGTVTVNTTAAPAAMPADPGALINELAALHGLTGPLQVTAASRSAGSITQTLATAGGTTTVTRT